MIACDVDNSLGRLLVCPVCKGDLEFRIGSASCLACDSRFPQSKRDCFELLPTHLVAGHRWAERQQEMEEWYRDLISTPARAGEWIAYDYAPFAPRLAELSGRVLDVGGGVGVARHYLPREAQYVVIDPSLAWLRGEWSAIDEYFPRSGGDCYFVRGVGEYLPFRARAFDVVLAFWSLNHASDPARVFQEAHRVLRAGGRFLAVLEDMEPNWSDLIGRDFTSRGGRRRAKVLGRKLWGRLCGKQWPVQSDHLRIGEADIRRWGARGFKLLRRDWINQFLTYEFECA